MPKVILSAGNISHYHHTALALQQAGWLWKYFCVFRGENDFGFLERLLPSSLRKRLNGKALPGLDPHRTRVFPLPYLFTQTLRRLHLTSQARTDAWFGALYDFATLHQTDGAGVFHFVNGMGLRTAQRVKKRGGIVICDVRAEHVDRQEETLRLEYDRLGLPYCSLRALYRDRLLAEYDTADFLIVPSSFVAESMMRSGIPPQKIILLPYGVTLRHFSPERSYHEQTQRRFRILFVGQIIPRKGIHHLVQAFTRLRLPSSELIIVGQGDAEYETLLKRLVTSDAAVRFIGQLPQAELWAYYQSADVFVLPTLSEGSALVVYEAMAAGLPVVTTPSAGSVVRDGVDGLLFPACDVDALQDKIQYLYQNPDARIAMGNSARERVREFTWERYRERLLEMYARILAGANA
ncbi:glycosyltransferase family 4 protein [Anaerolinea sp.]|uniref:glycosyltransferase family 4 protein n=1 Tax=Anaerolinea sp. TaxID=1872519 RepID=UPI002ACD8E90|nr:glycosyltransferase family 4 protein [Anaerolinea sp.]